MSWNAYTSWAVSRRGRRRQNRMGYIPALTEHVRWLEREIKKLASSPYRTDVESEIRLAKSAIQACRVAA